MKALAIDPKDRYQSVGRHGRRSRAHADRGALLQPRALEAAARPVPGRGRSVVVVDASDETGRAGDRPSPSRRRGRCRRPSDPHDGPTARTARAGRHGGDADADQRRAARRALAPRKKRLERAAARSAVIACVAAVGPAPVWRTGQEVLARPAAAPAARWRRRSSRTSRRRPARRTAGEAAGGSAQGDAKKRVPSSPPKGKGHRRGGRAERETPGDRPSKTRPMPQYGRQQAAPLVQLLQPFESLPAQLRERGLDLGQPRPVLVDDLEPAPARRTSDRRASSRGRRDVLLELAPFPSRARALRLVSTRPSSGTITSTSPAMAIAILSSTYSPEKLAPLRRTRTSPHRACSAMISCSPRDGLLVVVRGRQQSVEPRRRSGCCARCGCCARATITSWISAIAASAARRRSATSAPGTS